MKKTTKRTIALLLALCMVLALTSCGKKKPSTNNPASGTGSSTQTSTSTPSTGMPDPEPLPPDLNSLVDPDEINWGYEQDGSNDYQHWYPDGDKFSDYYLIFEDNYLCVRDGDGEEYYSTEIADGHVVNNNAENVELDFVFPDNLTCYDLVNNQWYMRADYNQAVPTLTAATFYLETGGRSFTFYDDGTYSYDFDGEISEGAWWFQDAYTIYLEDDYGTLWLDIYYAEDNWEIVALDYIDEMYYPG